MRERRGSVGLTALAFLEFFDAALRVVVGVRVDITGASVRVVGESLILAEQARFRRKLTTLTLSPSASTPAASAWHRPESRFDKGTMCQSGKLG